MTANPIAAIPAVPASRPPQQGVRLRKRLIRIVKERLGELEARKAALASESSSFDTLKSWLYRAGYHPSWSSIEHRAPLGGVRAVSQDEILRYAIAQSLDCWCLRLTFYKSRGDDLDDYELVLREAPWLNECLPMVETIVRDLQKHRSALIACDNEKLARALFAASASKRVLFHLYNSSGDKVG